MRTSRIAIIGVGEVGAATAYALLLGNIAGEILLVDVKIDFRDAQVRDLSDATYGGGNSTRIRAATYHEAAQCDIIIITAGAKQNIGQTRLQLINRNAAILRSILRCMKPFAPEAIIIIVANPVDLLTSLARELSGLPDSQIMGSGTFLDSVRLRGLLAEQTGIAASSIDVYVLGEHGDSQFIAWSSATIGGVPIEKALPPDSLDRHQLAESCKHKAQCIVRGKGATAFGIGYIVASMCCSILLDRRNVRPVSHYQPTLGCCLSLPVVLGRNGILKTIPLPLNEEETKDLTESAKTLKVALGRVTSLDS